MKEPVDHILRPCLPWREASRVTECGLNADSVKTLDRDNYFARVKDLGQTRAAMITCVTCADTARRHCTWQDDPRGAVAREIEWEGFRYMSRGRSDRGSRMKDELSAIAALIEAHREEFEAELRAIDQRREWLRLKSENERRQKAQTHNKPRGL